VIFVRDEFKETRAKVKAYYEKVGQLNIDPFDIPESPDEIELYVGWFFDRIRSIVSVENSQRKFGNVNEILALLGASAGDMGMDVKFSYYPGIGQWYIEFGDATDYLNLPHLAKHFGLMWRFKPRPNTLAAPSEEEIYWESEVVNEGSGDMFVYDRGGRD
jgi:hypothetical protein